MRLFGTTAALSAVILVGGCRGEFSRAEAEELARREQRLTERLAAATGDSAAAPLAKWVLPPQLLEVSGLALTANGHLLAHGDENAIIYAIDPRRGVVTKQFSFGETGLRGDFEGIAVSGGEVFVLESNGKIYRMREGNDGDRVDHTIIDTKLGKECEFEGIAIDPGGMIILACKNVAKDGPKDQVVIYRYDPRTARASMMGIPYARAIGDNDWKELNPSDITVDPTTKNYLLIAAQEKALLEITPAGEVVRTGPLPEPARQAEGVAASPQGILYVSDEGSTEPATIALYRWPLPPAPPATESLPESEQPTR
ncbi:MAG TPA: SdiA-regulated domain-containing protein [Gemmatimonadaceae bacterium]|nr:SdiA-regulated domain-containing protein [Gemmatimonadaceae bacterium]